MIEDAMNILEGLLIKRVKCTPALRYDTQFDVLHVELQGVNRNFHYGIYNFSKLLVSGARLSDIVERILYEYRKFIINLFLYPLDKKR